MQNFISIVVACTFSSCVTGDNVASRASDAGLSVDPKSCEGLAAVTEPATELGEVLLGTRVITPGISYTCDGVKTWSYWTRRRIDDGRIGSYGKFRIASTECAWFDALETRSPARGACP